MQKQINFYKPVIIITALYTTIVILAINMIISSIIGLPVYYCIANGLIGAFLCIAVRALPLFGVDI